MTLNLQHLNKEDLDNLIYKIQQNSPNFKNLNIKEIGEILKQKSFFKSFTDKEIQELILKSLPPARITPNSETAKNRGLKPKNYLRPEENIKQELKFNPSKKLRKYENAELAFEFDPVLIKVLETLNMAGSGVNIVGGAVRDAILGQKPKDIDFEVFGIRKENLIKILSHFGTVREQGASFGVIVLEIEREENGAKIKDEYEFAIPRKDSKTGKGYKGFEAELNPEMSAEEASKRRDFTLNSLSYNPITKELFDPNFGLIDLENGVIRHIDAKTFREDPLRILRAMQFQARIGFKIAPETLTLMKEMVESGEMEHLSKDRFLGEWRKWAVKGKYHSLIFNFLHESRLDKVYPEFKEFPTTPQDTEYHPEGNVEEHTMQVLAKMQEICEREGHDENTREILVLTGLLHDIAKPTTTEKVWSEKLRRFKISAHGHEAAGVEPAEKFLQKIGVSQKNIDIIKPLIREHLAHASICTIENEKGRMSAFIRLVERLKPANVELLLLLMEADMLGRNNANSAFPESILVFKELLEKYKAIHGGEKFKPLLTGKDLLKFGFTPGPEMGKILNTAKEAQIEEKFKGKNEAMLWLKNYLNEKAFNTLSLKNKIAKKATYLKE